MEAKRLESAQEAANCRTEERLRRQALLRPPLFPARRPSKCMQRQVQGIMQPLIAEVREIKKRLQGNRSALVETDGGGAGTKSAKKSRKQSPGCNFAEADQSAALEARGGTKKRRRRSVEARERDDPALAPSSAAESGDCLRKTGSKGGGKQGGRRSRSAANKDQE